MDTLLSLDGEQVHRCVGAHLTMDSEGEDICAGKPASADLDRWMVRYQAADREAASTLIRQLTPALLRFFRSQAASREYADDLLQETWLRIHRVRHTWRPGEPVLPWIYAIAHHVRIDGYRKRQRIAKWESAVDTLPERPTPPRGGNPLHTFDTLLSSLPESQREVLTMLKVDGLSLEEVARVTSSSIGAVKQKAHRAYEKLRSVLGNLYADEAARGRS